MISKNVVSFIKSKVIYLSISILLVSLVSYLFEREYSNGIFNTITNNIIGHQDLGYLSYEIFFIILVNLVIYSCYLVFIYTLYCDYKNNLNSSFVSLFKSSSFVKSIFRQISSIIIQYTLLSLCLTILFLFTMLFGNYWLTLFVCFIFIIIFTLIFSPYSAYVYVNNRAGLFDSIVYSFKLFNRNRKELIILFIVFVLIMLFFSGITSNLQNFSYFTKVVGWSIYSIVYLALLDINYRDKEKIASLDKDTVNISI